MTCTLHIILILPHLLLTHAVYITCQSPEYAPSWSSTLCLQCPAGSFTTQQSCMPMSITIPSSVSTCNPFTYDIRRSFNPAYFCGTEEVRFDYDGEYSTVFRHSTDGTSFNTLPFLTCSEADAYNDDNFICHMLECQTTAREMCIICPPGTFSTANAWECTTCPAGSFNTAAGSTACRACPQGQSSPAGSTVCTSCQPGKYNNVVGGVCLDCIAGTYMSAIGAAACTACSAGSYSTDIGRTSECIPCRPTTYTPSPGATTCISCPAYTYSATGTPGSTMSPMYGSSSINNCKACPAGTGGVVYYDTDATTSISTPLFMYDAYPSPSSCPSAIWQYAGLNQGFPFYRCDSNSLWYCKVNYAYYWWWNAAYPSGEGLSLPSNQFMVALHQPGFLQPQTPIMSCMTCPAGTYSNITGASACSQCPSGTYSSRYASSCQGCFIGTYSSGVGITSSSTCTACLPGTYGPTNGLEACLKCSQGFYSLAVGATLVSTCTACSTGFSTDEKMGQTQCTQCPQGTFSTPGATTCAQCPAGTYGYAPGISACINCTRGSYSSSLSKQTCTPCDFGLYTTATRATTCMSCSAGTYAYVTGSTTCTQCPNGTGSFPAARACVTCV